MKDLEMFQILHGIFDDLSSKVWNKDNESELVIMKRSLVNMNKKRQ